MSSDLKFPRVTAAAEPPVCWGCALQLHPAQVTQLVMCPYCGAYLNCGDSNFAPGFLRKSGGSSSLVEATGSSNLVRKSFTWRLVYAIIEIAEDVVQCASHPPVRRLWSGVFVCFVLAAAAAFSAGVILTIFPFVVPSAPSIEFFVHWVVCLYLLANSLLNYGLAISSDPGYVGQRVIGSREVVSASSLAHWCYCERCKAAQPPKAFHCRMCRRCVQDMHHHCPFIANCVGAGNKRAFVLFLFWTLCSMVYILCLTSYAVIFRLDDIMEIIRAATKALPAIEVDTIPDYLEVLIILELNGISLWHMVLLVFGATFVALMASPIFFQMLSSLLSENKGAPAARPSRISIFRSLVGSGPWWTWFIPRLSASLFNFTIANGTDAAKEV
eukprot:TRINITY_DN29813_c0_g1_i1.p1 TRINITY_DN29813_c0_g1~~TRINITY_DN29813_c0_g1_i1.p1  ORF type:complete len:385 (-),score=53.56 TRINITY_DN29813_c0_g1_i1:81-1235(-)